MKRLFAIPLLLIVLPAKAELLHCGYMESLEELLKTDPAEAADEHRHAHSGTFMSIGAGIGPKRPGFESSQEAKCAEEKHGFTLFWAGGDVLACPNQADLARKAIEYAGIYNVRVKASLVEQGAYECSL